MKEQEKSGVEIREFPVPGSVSPQLAALMRRKPYAWWNTHLSSKEEWKAWAGELSSRNGALLPALCRRMRVRCEEGHMGGVHVYRLIPEEESPAGKGRMLLHFHSGGFLINTGDAAPLEAVMMCGITGMRAVSVDYRSLPGYAYPAPMEEAVNVYRELLESFAPGCVGVFGSSSGGALTLELVLHARLAGLPQPGALAAGTPCTDFTPTGDSFATNEGVDNVLVSYSGWLTDAVRMFAAGHDLTDPLISPIRADVSGFPPVMLTCGTRDLFLSSTVRMHRKLREAGVPADLVVIEGASHMQYAMLPDAPETAYHFRELGRFFDTCLGR